MKNIVNIVNILIIVLLLSCQQIPDDNLSNQQMTKIHIQASLISKDDIEEGEKSRSENQLVSRMAFFLFKEDGSQVLEQQKTNNEDGFLNFYAEVPVGAYHLIAFAHNGDSNVSVSKDNTITPEGKVTDSFHYYQKITLDENSENMQNITLNRCVAKFSIKHTDAIPEGATSVEIRTSGGNKTINAMTGFASDVADQTVVINIPSSAVGSKNNSFSIYTFLTQNESILNITATVKDTNGNNITQYTFENVEMEINMQTIYTGAFFHSDRGFAATINDKWKDDNHISF